MKNILLVLTLIFSCSLYSREYYVTVNGNNNNDGLTEESAWRNISYAASRVKSGDIIWIKTGLYTGEKIVIKNSGVIGSPISLIGYRNKKGDLSNADLTYSKDKRLNFNEFPLIRGASRDYDTAIEFSKKKYIIIKNLQIENYEVGIFSSSGGNNVIENVVAGTFGKTDDYSGRGIHLNGTKNKILNTLVFNATASNVTVYGDDNIIDNVSSYCDESLEKGSKASTDYYITVRGNRNLIKNCYVERIGDLQHHGHGITLRGKDNSTVVENNRVEDCKIVNIKGALECRRTGVRYNTFKNIIIEGNPKYPNAQTGGIVIQGGASHNVFDGIKVKGVGEAIRFNGNLDENAKSGGSGNVIKNSLFIDLGAGIVGNLTTRNKIGVYDNLISNTVFYNVRTLIQSSTPIDNSNRIVNCIVNNVRTFESKSSKAKSNFTYEHNTFYSNGFNMLKGTNNNEYAPEFIDVQSDNFRLRESSKLINAGKKVDEVDLDYDGNERPQGGSLDIGAFELIENSTGLIKANAGEDQRICLGEEVTLTASGGSAYLWSDGSTTRSIKVSPSENTVYEVKVSNETSSDIDDVLVRVDNLVADAGSDITIKAGEEVTLNASGGGEYLWNTGETTPSITVSPTKDHTYTVTVIKFGCEDMAEVKVKVEQSTIPTVVAYAGEDERICLGEEITLTASGGSTYLWSNGLTTKSIKVSPSENTVYEVKVTEGTSSDDDDVFVRVDNIVADAGSNVTIKAGEQITLNASGGGKYLWNTGQTTSSITVSPTKNSTYTVTVRKFGCEDTAEVKVTVEQTIIPTVVANAGEDRRICLGEEVTLTASGGSTYLWSNGATTKSIKVSPSENTRYNVKVSTGNSSDTDDVLIVVDEIIANAGADVEAVAGESVKLTASGGDSFLWSTGETTKSINVLSDKTVTYSVKVFKNNCEANDKVVVRIVQADVDTHDVIADAGEDQTICLGQSAVLIGSGGDTYFWNNGNLNDRITVSPTRTTTYTLEATNNGISDTDTVTIYVENCEDTADLENEKSTFQVYPNPTENVLNVNALNLKEDIDIQLINTNGKIIIEDTLEPGLHTGPKVINVSYLTKGIYFLRFFNEYETSTKKIVVI